MIVLVVARSFSLVELVVHHSLDNYIEHENHQRYHHLQLTLPATRDYYYWVYSISAILLEKEHCTRW